jgi:hypothetical protein
LTFRIGLKDNLLEIGIGKEGVIIKNLSEKSVEISIFGSDIVVGGQEEFVKCTVES